MMNSTLIRAAREAAGWSRVDLAKRVGCAHTTIRNLERDLSRVSPAMRQRIEAALNGRKGKVAASAQRAELAKRDAKQTELPGKTAPPTDTLRLAVVDHLARKLATLPTVTLVRLYEGIARDAETVRLRKPQK